MLVVDGGGDVPTSRLGGRTAFEAADTPCLDRLAEAGVQGLLTLISGGVCPESDSGAMSLLSYDPLSFYTGRGPLEALGAGFPSRRYSASFRVNFACYDPSLGLLDRRTARDLSDEELSALAAEVLRDVDIPQVEVDMEVFGHHRGVISFSSTSLAMSGNVSNTDPGFVKNGVWGEPVQQPLPVPLECLPLDAAPESANCARVVNEFVRLSAAVLESSDVNRLRQERGQLRANYLLLRDGGSPPGRLPKFEERLGLSVSMYGQIPAERAIALLGGGTFAYARKGDEPHEDYYARIVRQILDDPADLVFAHLAKDADEAGHGGDAAAKVRAIEIFDEFLVGPVSKSVRREDVIIVTSDHATPCDLMIHSANPVAAVVAGGAVSPDGTTRFGESFARSGGLPVQAGHELLPWVLEHAVVSS